MANSASSLDATTQSATRRDIGRPPVEWLVSREPVPYAAACAFMEQRADAIAAGSGGRARLAARASRHLHRRYQRQAQRPAEPDRLPVHRTGRGGQYTYHGPGQRVVYVMLDVERRFGDVRAYVAALEAWIIDALAEFGVAAQRRDRARRRLGAPAGRGREYDKIAAIGVRLRRWVSSHGVSLNVAPDLEHFAGIVPCGIRDDGVTSLARLGRPASWSRGRRRLARRLRAPLRPDLRSSPREAAACAARIRLKPRLENKNAPNPLSAGQLARKIDRRSSPWPPGLLSPGRPGCPPECRARRSRGCRPRSRRRRSLPAGTRRLRCR